MTIPPYIHHQPVGESVTSYDLVRLQGLIKTVLDEIANTRRPHLSGEFIEFEADGSNINLDAGIENLIEHGLGREVRGWSLVDIQGPALVWRVASPSTSGYDETRHLALGCSQAVTIKLVVF